MKNRGAKIAAEIITFLALLLVCLLLVWGCATILQRIAVTLAWG